LRPSATIRAAQCWPIWNGPPGLPGSAAEACAFFEYRAKQLAERKLAQRKQAGGSMGNSPASDRVMKANANAQISAEPPDRDQQNQGANVGH